MERSILLAKNPWWKGKEHFKEDEDYKKWEEKKIKWIPKTVNSYLHMLKELFLINISYYIVPNSLTINFGKKNLNTK